MLMSLMVKISLMLLCMSVFNIGRHTIKIIKILREDTPNSYKLDKLDLILLGLSVAYVFTTIYTGISL